MMPGEVWGKIIGLVLAAAIGVAVFLWVADRGIERVRHEDGASMEEIRR